MGVISYALGLYRKAIPFLEYVAENDPYSFVDPQLMLVEAYHFNGKTKLALERGQDWLDIHPNNDYGRDVEKACAKLRKKLATTKQRGVTDAEEATSN